MSLPGPPCVIAKISVKSDIVPSVISSRLVMIVGRMIGSITENSRRQYEAPSSCAASSTSAGTSRRPAVNTSIENAVPRQAFATHTISNGVRGAGSSRCLARAAA